MQKADGPKEGQGKGGDSVRRRHQRRGEWRIMEASRKSVAGLLREELDRLMS